MTTANEHELDWNALRRRLEARRHRIAQEISAYPTPIAACDAHINALIAERERVNEELNRLEEVARSAPDGPAARAALEAFIRTSALADG